jgi:hypothetical protein
MDPPPPPPDRNPQQESPRRIRQAALAHDGRVNRPARGQARLLDHALLSLLLIANWKIKDKRLSFAMLAIFLVFFNDNALRSIDFLEATVIRQPLRPRDYVLLGMLVVAKFNSMLVYGLPIALLTYYSGLYITDWLFPAEQPRPPRSHRTKLAFLWAVLLFKYDWLISGLFLGFVHDMPFTDFDGSRGLYTGQVNGVMLKPHDMLGQLVYKNGGTYTGYFENGVKNAQVDSVMKESNGGVYVGNFKDDKMDGYGALMSGDGKTIFRGEMKDGKPNGRGLLMAKDGFVYEGQFVDAKMQGRGIMTTAEGEKLVGSFSNAKLQGNGIVRGPNGLLPLISGNFQDGLLHGIAISVDRDLNMYFGNFQNGKRHGYGLLITPKGLVQKGNWSDGLLHGQAEIVYPGNGFTGQFRHGKKHGRGVVTNRANLTTYEGEWRDGELVDGAIVDGDDVES